MSLTARIVVLVLAVQLALVAALGVFLAANAREAVAAEVAASMRSARELVLTTVAALIDTVPGEQLPATLAERLVEPRHARILIYDAASGRMASPHNAAPRPDPAPEWFTRLLAPRVQSTQLQVVENRTIRGLAMISGDPAAEIAKVWDDARTLFGLLALAGLAQLALIWAALRAGLRPLSRVSAVLDRLAGGDLGARAGRVRTPDLAPLAADVDRLAQALTDAQADRARLSRQVVGRGDQERAAIARDLHDEYGPCLFALRVEAGAIRDTAPGDTHGDTIRDHAENILTIADQIRQVNSALLSGLRPMALGQLPLAIVLSDLFDDLALRNDTIRWSLDLPQDLPEPDEATALTIYRILQEGTTNALRHASATSISAAVAHDPQGWTVRLSDDGIGLRGAAEGNGLSGMRERVGLLGGSFDVQDGARGVTIRATLPDQTDP